MDEVRLGYFIVARVARARHAASVVRSSERSLKIVSSSAAGAPRRCAHTDAAGLNPRGTPGRVNLFLSLRTERVVSSRISALQGGAHKSAA
jgi:hypothetical protein